MPANQEITAYPITEEFFDSLETLPNWEETQFKQGCAVESHKHSHGAMYFTKDVKSLKTEGSKRDLPKYAAVYVPKGREHGWSGVAQGSTQAVVGHFHTGHGLHSLVPEY